MEEKSSGVFKHQGNMHLSRKNDDSVLAFVYRRVKTTVQRGLAFSKTQYDTQLIRCLV